MTEYSPMVPQFGTMKRIPLRTVWPNEATSFTPWLAQEANLRLLSESLDLPLQYEAQEQAVGLFRADLLAKNTQTDQWVLIENQFDRSDHTHLGQILTYAAGLQASIVVWIAEQFTDEHCAALDWLNSIPGQTIRFFGVELELWQIGQSDIAARFRVVVAPNAQSRLIDRPKSNRKKSNHSSEKSEELQPLSRVAQRDAKIRQFAGSHPELTHAKLATRFHVSVSTIARALSAQDSQPAPANQQDMELPADEKPASNGHQKTQERDTDKLATVSLAEDGLVVQACQN